MEIILSFEKDAILIPDEVLKALGCPKNVTIEEEGGKMYIMDSGVKEGPEPMVMIVHADHPFMTELAKNIPDFDPENKYEVEGWVGKNRNVRGWVEKNRNEVGKDGNEVKGYGETRNGEAGENIIVFDLGDATSIRKNNIKKNVVMIPEMGLEEWYVKEVVKDYIKLRKVCRQLQSSECNPPLDNLLVLIETMIPAFARIFEFDDSGTEYDILLELVCSEADDDEVKNVLLGGWI